MVRQYKQIMLIQIQEMVCQHNQNQTTIMPSGLDMQIKVIGAEVNKNETEAS